MTTVTRAQAYEKWARLSLAATTSISSVAYFHISSGSHMMCIISSIIQTYVFIAQGHLGINCQIELSTNEAYDSPFMFQVV